MALVKISKESRWTLKGTYGVGDGAVLSGTVVTVQAICPPGTPGVGGDGTDTVLASWVEGPDDNLVARSISVPVDDFITKFEPLAKAVKSSAG